MEFGIVTIMTEIPPEIFADLKEDFVGLNQFENLVLQKINDFGNFYANQFCDNWPDTYPDFMSVENWMVLFKAYLIAGDKYEAIKVWGSIRNGLKEID